MAIGMNHDRKQKQIRLIILSCLVLIPILTYLETKVFSLGEISLPISGNVLIFMLINVNVLLLLLVAFLVLRNLVHLIFERRKKLLGSRLRIKLVVSFMSLSLVPTALLFFVALQFVSTSMDYWFNINVEQALQKSLEIGKDFYQDARDRVIRTGESMAKMLATTSPDVAYSGALNPVLEITFNANELDAIELLSADRKNVVFRASPRLSRQILPELPANLIRRALSGEKNITTLQTIPSGDLVRGVVPVINNANPENPALILVTTLLIPQERLQKMELVSQALSGYRQLMLLKTPIKTSLLVMLLVVTLLIVFCAIWFGFYVAKGLTVPIGKLAEATKRVADGELDFVLKKDADDEMGILVDSFNQMTRDLLTSKRQIEETNLALKKSYLELDQRRRYTEIILQNVPAGVISVDGQGRISTMNRFAEELLGINRNAIDKKDYRTLLDPDYQVILDDLLKQLEQPGRSSMQRPLCLTINDQALSLLLNITRLEDDVGHHLGFVLVFDDLTQLEKAQRMAAWREVARRIAHEVKNPLTPIQLSAQRLRKRYLDVLADEGDVFDQCTRTIITQVDELKRLVSEFSNFARMPAVQPRPNHLSTMAQECLVLYREAHKKINFSFQADPNIPAFEFDYEQMKQVLINLLDNAVAVLPEGGAIEVILLSDEEQKLVVMEVRDNGPGIADEIKPRLFEPYFSTKKIGTGLGLAIASTIVADHGGYIRVKNNLPCGARFIVEIPLRISGV